MTPLERPEFLGDVGSKLYPTASLLNWAIGVALDWTRNTSDPERGAPPKEDGVNVALALATGRIQRFYIDMGSEITQAEEVVRTSVSTAVQWSPARYLAGRER